jgi:hypothetical protein
MTNLAWRVTLATLGLLVTVTSASAQSTTLYLIRPDVTTAMCPYAGCNPGPARLIEVSVEDARIVSTRAVPFEHSGSPILAATAEGRYLVWLGNDATSHPPVSLSLYDRVSGTTGVAFRSVPRSSLSVPYYRILAHPTQTRVFARLRDVPTIDAGTAGIKALDLGGESQTLHGITADGRVALISKDDQAVAYLVDTDSSTVIGQVPGRQLTGLWAIGPDGTSIYGYGTRRDGATLWNVFTRYDRATGSILSEQEYDDGPLTTVKSMETDPRSGRLYADLGDSRYRVLDPATLQEIGVVTSPLPPLPPLPPHAGRNVTTRLVFDPHHPRAFLLSNRQMRPETFDPGASRLDIVDTNTLAIVGGADLGMQVGPSDVAVVPRPSAPTALTADVAGARVTLRWTVGTGPGLAAGFRVEAGSGPGLSNLAIFNVGVTGELVVERVPAGTYYVRVKGTNWGGASDSSNEITVTVP